MRFQILSMSHSPWTLGVSLLACLAVSALSGCGASRDTVNVSGRVQYKDGSPIEGAIRVIRFEPTDESTAQVRKAASAEIAPDGTYEVFTRKPGDGIFRGRYAVNFTVLTSYTNGKSLIKPMYESPVTTPFVVDVTDDISDLNFELEQR